MRKAGRIEIRRLTFFPITLMRNLPSWGTRVCNVETGENLDARRDRELQRFRRRLRRDQVAINAVAQFQRPIKRLNVNIRSFFLDRLGEDQFYDLDHGRVLAVGRETIRVDVFAFLRLHLDIAGCRFLERPA